MIRAVLPWAIAATAVAAVTITRRWLVHRRHGRRFCPGPPPPLWTWALPWTVFRRSTCLYDLSNLRATARGTRCPECDRLVTKSRQMRSIPARWRLGEVVLVCLVIKKTGSANIADSLRTITYDLGLALLYALLFTFLKVLKWHRLVQAGAGEGSSLGEAAKSYFVGMAGGLLTPGRVGEVARTMFLEIHEKSLVAYLVVLDRVFEVAAVLFLALPGLYYFLNPFFAALGVLLLALLLAALYYPEYPLRWLCRVLERSGKFAGARQQLGRTEARIAAISPGAKLKQLGLSLLSYGIVFVQFYHLLNNYDQGRLPAVLLAQPLIMLTNIMPFTIGGLGIREGAAMVLLSRFGVPRAAAISSAFMLFLLNTALPAIIGALLFSLPREKKR